MKRFRKKKDPYNLDHHYNFKKSFRFCIVCMILFYGISSYMFIFDWVTMKDPKETPEWWAGKEKFDKYIKRDLDFTFSIGDSKISNLEGSIIYVLMFWGFMRTIDFFKLVEEEKIFYWNKYFFELCENL